MGSRLVLPVSTTTPPYFRRERARLTDTSGNTDVYCRKLDVVNRGLSGFNTEWAIPVFEQVSWADFLFQSGC